VEKFGSLENKSDPSNTDFEILSKVSSQERGLTLISNQKYLKFPPALGEARLWRLTLPLSSAGEREEVRGLTSSMLEINSQTSLCKNRKWNLLILTEFFR